MYMYVQLLGNKHVQYNVHIHVMIRGYAGQRGMTEQVHKIGSSDSKTRFSIILEMKGLKIGIPVW